MTKIGPRSGSVLYRSFARQTNNENRARVSSAYHAHNFYLTCRKFGWPFSRRRFLSFRICKAQPKRGRLEFRQVRKGGTKAGVLANAQSPNEEGLKPVGSILISDRYRGPGKGKLRQGWKFGSVAEDTCKLTPPSGPLWTLMNINFGPRESSPGQEQIRSFLPYISLLFATAPLTPLVNLPTAIISLDVLMLPRLSCFCTLFLQLVRDNVSLALISSIFAQFYLYRFICKGTCLIFFSIHLSLLFLISNS